MKKRLGQTLSSTKFKDSPVVAISACPNDGSEPAGIDELNKVLGSYVTIPSRNMKGPFLFAVDHCFAIKGKGTVMTGTILQGQVQINDVSTLLSIIKIPVDNSEES